VHENLSDNGPVISSPVVSLLPEPAALNATVDALLSAGGEAVQSRASHIRETIEGILFYGVLGLGIGFPLFAMLWVAITR
jgi:hypothetical protein